MTYLLPTNATTNITGMYTLFQYIQTDLTGGWFFLMMLLALFIIVFISLKGYSNSRAFAGAAWLNMILSIILRTVGFIDNKWMYLSIILVAVSAVWLHLEGAQRV